MTIIFPKRLTPPAKPGELLKRHSEQPQRDRMGRTVGEPDYRALVQQLPCLYCGVEPCGECCHVKYSSSEFGRTNSLGRRPHDRFTVPLCRDDHLNARHAQHKGSEEAFWLGLGIEPYFVAKHLWEQRGDLVAMRAVVVVAIMNRSKS